MEKRLFLNTLTFDYPKEPVKFYFSATNDAARKMGVTLNEWRTVAK